MNHANFFKKLFESIEDYRKIALLMFLIKSDKGLLKICGFLKSDIIRSSLEGKNILKEQNEDYLDYIKEKEPIIE